MENLRVYQVEDIEGVRVPEVILEQVYKAWFRKEHHAVITILEARRSKNAYVLRVIITYFDEDMPALLNAVIFVDSTVKCLYQTHQALCQVSFSRSRKSIIVDGLEDDDTYYRIFYDRNGRIRYTR